MGPRQDSAPAATAIDALEYAVSSALCHRVERSRRLRVDGQNRHSSSMTIDGQAGVDRAPASPAIGALEYAVEKCPRIEGGWRLGVDGQGHHPRVG